MRHTPISARLLTNLALAVLAGFALVHAAAGATYAAGSETRIVDTLTDPELSTGYQPVSAHSVGGQTGTVATTAAQAAVTVTTGGIHLSTYSTSEAMQGPSLIYSQAEARGGFTDEFVLFAAGIPSGSLGVITVAFGVSGTLGATGYGGGGFDDGLGRGARSEWRARFDLHGNNDGVVWEGNQSVFVDAGGSIPGGNATVGVQLFTFPVAFGETLWLSFSASVGSSSAAQATFPVPASVGASANASFGHTVSWQGIVSLVDAHGAPVTGFSALSPSSGFDYAQAYVSAVPEPATWLLSLCGFAFISGVRGKFRRGPARRPALT